MGEGITDTMPRSSEEDEEVELVRAARAGLEEDPGLARFARSGFAAAGTVRGSSEKLDELEGVVVRNALGLFGLEVRLPQDPTEIERPLQMLMNLSVAIDVLDHERRELVRECRARGRSWADIGEALGVSRQTAWEKYSSPEE